jgi:hypothetical protein
VPKPSLLAFDDGGTGRLVTQVVIMQRRGRSRHWGGAGDLCHHGDLPIPGWEKLVKI